MQTLGPNWAWILTDFTRGAAGSQERMAFVFDLRRVQPSGPAAELVVPLEQETTLTETTLQKQFARTPYAVSFESQGTTFTLVTLYVLWGDNSAQRVPEIREIARWLADWAKGGDEFGENLMNAGRLQHRPRQRNDLFADFCDPAGCTLNVAAFTGPVIAVGGDSGAPFYVPGSTVAIRGMLFAKAGNQMYAEKWSVISNNLGVVIRT